ncbi:alpha-mannosidase II [Paragonimus westermani]|uniref:mannosyl-oligosaccharide 1,3-1,6-alpha-mannosidase n=1 Tax=Paragonimus westermani TaxID=34504 RepID=A0A5J4NV57_9TREM|nr:alpha-mannosidase II [Paragonimus westermani]
MTDEATAHHYGMLDQLIEGHHWLLDTFGYHPNTSWSIDPFGHSPTVAYLARQMQFSGMVIQRVHYEVKKYLAERKSLEFRWRQLWDGQGSTEIISHMMPFYSYDIPHTCGPDPSICCQFDFVRLDRFHCPWGKPPLPISEGNIAERATALRDQYCQKAMLFNNSGVLLVPLGDDFRYLSEKEWELQLDNYDQIITYWNSHPQLGIRARFATLSDYFTTLHKRLGSHPGMTPVTKNLPTLSGDLFTYADRNQDYWSGLFTSRPNLKSLVRVLESELQAAELLYSYAQYLIGLEQSMLTVRPIIENLYRNLTGARRNLGLFQHHDGVTGTAKPHVVDDYTKRLISAIKEARLVSTMSAAYLLLLLSSRKFSNPRLPVGPDMRDLLQNVVAQSDKRDDQGSKVLSLENRFLTNSLPQPELYDFTNPELARDFAVANRWLKFMHSSWKVLRLSECLVARMLFVFLFAASDLPPFILHSCLTVCAFTVHVTAQAVEIENVVDLSDFINLELVMRIRTNITGALGNPARTFYTDSNCFQFIRRTYHEKLPLQGNLYPMTCATFLDGGRKTNSDGNVAAAPSLPSSLLRLTLLSAQSLGITSQAEGELSVWLDRRAPKDDDRGLEAPLLGRWTAVSKFRVLLEEVIPAQTHGDLTDVVPQLTLTAHFVLLDLLRPVQRFSVDPDLASLMLPWLTLMPQFVLPCDYEVVNLKTFHSPATLLKSASSPSGSQLGLLLRRLSTFTPTVGLASPQQTSFCNAVETDETSGFHSSVGMPGRTFPDWESGEPLLEISPVDPSTLARLKREYWRRKYGTRLNPRKRWLLTLFGLTLILMFIMLAVMFMQLASVAYNMRHFFALMIRLNRNRHNSSTFVA